MIRTHKKTLVLTSIIILLPILIGLVLWNRLPDEIATHFGADGTPNGFSSKAFAVFGLPLFLLACHWICTLGTQFGPRKENISGKLMRIVLWVCPAVSLLCAFFIYGYAFSLPINFTRIILLFLAVLFIIVGNYLPKCRQNYVMGIKLPWTLADAENWNRTHRLAGYLWMAGGLLLLPCTFVPSVSQWILLPLMVCMVGVPTVYSFLLARKKNG